MARLRSKTKGEGKGTSGSGGLVAVITGDVIGSRRLAAPLARRLGDTLRASGELVGEIVGPEVMPLPVDVFRGDSWQMLLSSPVPALRAMLLFRAHFRAAMQPDSRSPVDTRMAFAVGRLEPPLPARVSESLAPVFQRSGTALEAMRDRRMSLAEADTATESEAVLPAEWDVILRLLDEFASDWTAKQALAVEGALRGLRQEEIGALWKPAIKQPTVADHLRAAHWNAVEHALDAYEARAAGAASLTRVWGPGT
jgi:hypothetical protein